MRKKNQLKRKIAHGDYVIGTWCTLPSPSVINVLGASGLDFVIIDMEHGPTDFVTAEDMIRSAESEECSPLIRVPSNNESDILRALDIGAHGIIVPNIESVDDREKAVSYIKYPPSGIRGFSPYTRAGNYSNLDSNYTAKENKEIMTVLIVEGIEGLKNLEGIINDPQIDVIYIGTYDLSQAIGKPGKVNHIQVKEELEECVKKIRNHGKAAGCLIHNRNELQWFTEIGIQFITYLVDNAVLFNDFSNMKKELDKIIE